jgi:hypothetical protein
MTKQNIRQGFATTGLVFRKTVQVAKFAVIAALVLISILGGYVLVNAELRNHTIDFAQGQAQVQAESPKAQ